MKQTYQKPEVELVKLLAVEMIADSTGNVSTSGDHDEFDPWA